MAFKAFVIWSCRCGTNMRYDVHPKVVLLFNLMRHNLKWGLKICWHLNDCTFNNLFIYLFFFVFVINDMQASLTALRKSRPRTATGRSKFKYTMPSKPLCKETCGQFAITSGWGHSASGLLHERNIVLCFYSRLWIYSFYFLVFPLIHCAVFTFYWFCVFWTMCAWKWLYPFRFATIGLWSCEIIL